MGTSGVKTPEENVGFRRGCNPALPVFLKLLGNAGAGMPPFRFFLKLFGGRWREAAGFQPPFLPCAAKGSPVVSCDGGIADGTGSDQDRFDYRLLRLHLRLLRACQPA